LSQADHWVRVARHSPLGFLLDLDGTLVPLAETPDLARPKPELVESLDALASMPGIALAVVSGRPRSDLERFFGDTRSIWLAAEHGAFLRDAGGWQSPLACDPLELQDLQSRLEELAASAPGAFAERKSLSITFHYRRVPRPVAPGLHVEASSLIEEWLRTHPAFECISGAEALEVRPTGARKSVAVSWVRGKAGPEARIVALGDDVTDEDMFAALGAADEGIVVSKALDRATAARWLLEEPGHAIRFLEWIGSARRGPLREPAVLPRPLPRPPPVGRGRHGLLAISNRLPEPREVAFPEHDRKRQAGGLVSALEPVIAARDGLWLGWSGHTAPGDAFGPVVVDAESSPTLASIDFPANALKLYYNGFCNRSLWPLFHSLPGRVRFADAEWDAYVAVNERLAEVAVGLVEPGCAIWVHDFHLLMLASALQRRGHRGPIGLFLHVPFPAIDCFRLIPWADVLLDGLLSFDLIGLQTPYDVRNLLHVVGALTPAKVSDDALEHRGRRTRVLDFPIGIVPEAFEPPAETDESEETTLLLASLEGRRLVLGIDRLDYTKGIMERLKGFARFLAHFPAWRGQVSYVQISVPSRADVVEYQEQRARIESAVGRINGEYGEAHWTPVRYLYRSYRRGDLARLYRAADVCLVTPLRDGMNLIAKEFVAAQEEGRPGVLVLSRFAGAALELHDSVLTNPFHPDGMARDLDRALRMPASERVERHTRLLAAVRRTTADAWAETFVSALEACRGSS
jgi:trehalose 6-phosphate synthase